jgi:hypothetical protein
VSQSALTAAENVRAITIDGRSARLRVAASPGTRGTREAVGRIAAELPEHDGNISLTA